MIRRIAVLLALSLLPVVAVATVQHPNLESGFDAGKSFTGAGVDHVSLFSGNLTLTIPIGGGYSAGGGLSYSFSLVYNSNSWAWELHNCPGDDLPSECTTLAIVPEEYNAGLGMQLHLGRLVEPWSPPRNDTPHWLYIGADGSEHFLSPRLHGIAQNGDTYFSNDSSYLRLREDSPSPGQQTVEFPNGTRQIFSGGLLRTILDRHENFLFIHYSEPDELTWTLIDNTGRVHTIEHEWRPMGFQENTGQNPLVRMARVVKRVQLAAFGGGAAVYSFDYEETLVPAPHPHNDPLVKDLPMSLLTQVTLPDGSFYKMRDASGLYYYVDDSGNDSQRRKAGVLTRIRLPTGGGIEWTYGDYEFSYVSDPVVANNWRIGDPIDIDDLRSYINLSTGVTQRQLLDESGQAIGNPWRYVQKLWCRDGQDDLACYPDLQPIQATNKVVDPLGHKTVHYFSTAADVNFPLANPAAVKADYGRPYTIERNKSGRYLSTRVYEATGALVRSNWLRFDRSPNPIPGGQDEGRYDHNHRVQAERTLYHDNGNQWADIERSEFDGLGNYRRSETDGTFLPAAANERTSYTNYNPSAGTYPGSFTLPLASQAWILNMFDEQTEEENGVTARRTYCFDANGLLKRERIHKGSSPGSADVLRVYDYTNGNRDRERHYGGDTQTLGTSPGLCSLGLPGAPQYDLRHTYQHGSLATSKYAAFGHLLVDRTIDRNTGLPASSTDITGKLTTDYDYDSMGRLTEAEPPAGHGARTEYDYSPSNASGSAPKVTVTQFAHPGFAQLAKSQTIFDSLGRPVEERRRMPDNSWSKRKMTYFPQGWTSQVSTWSPDGASGNDLYWTRHQNYDPFGRPRTIVPPDGPGHKVLLSYAGVERITRKAKVGTSYNAATGQVIETLETTTELYDRQGRLHRVEEPSGGLVADYLYDIGNRLEKATLTPVGGGPVQTRNFTYDHRGFLTREVHPESGDTRFSTYDARGHAGRRRIFGGSGEFDLTYVYDAAERLIRIRETSDPDPGDGVPRKTYKEFIYATSDAGSVYGEGKLERAIRHNWIRVPIFAHHPWQNFRVTETYRYNGKGGRASKRTTAFSMQKGQTFEQSWSWDDLGNPKTITYPRCIHDECAPSAGPPRTVSFNYSNGSLTSVPGYASSITYHPNGMLHQVHHTNGNVDTIAQDPWRMRRPHNISVSGPAGNPSLGVHKYDGSGNLVSKDLDGLFLYDRVGRLKYFEAGNGGDQTYTYDAYGNMTGLVEQRPTGTEVRSFPVSAATNRLTTAAYDDAGNITSTSGQVYEYDGLNMMRHRNFPEHTYLYTADDERFLTFRFTGTPGGENTEEWTWTLRDFDGRVLTRYDWNGGVLQDWTWKQDTIYRDGLMLAKETSELYPLDEQHFHLDHLGTPRLTTRANGAVYAANHYFGFGDALNETSDPERKKFTGHERDKNGGATHTKLDYMHARYYSPYMGRFTSVDMGPADLQQPQSWNRFTYALNSPVLYTDPTGETVILTDLTEDQRQKLVDSLNEVTGNTYGVNKNDELVVVAYGDDASATATSFLDDLISPEAGDFNVKSSSKVLFAGNPKGTKDILINFADFDHLDYGDIAPATFSVGTSFLHEAAHAALGLGDPDDFFAGETSVGDAAAYVNRIRSERGFLERGPAYNPTPSGHFGQRQGINFRDPDRPKKIKYIYFPTKIKKGGK